MFDMEACDDDVTINTQATSQWDGLSMRTRHYSDTRLLTETANSALCGSSKETVLQRDFLRGGGP
jgi:hypothetical protein